MMFLSILQEASPNALHEIDSPLPRLIAVHCPLSLVGEWIIDKHERSLTAFSFVFVKLAISCKG